MEETNQHNIQQQYEDLMTRFYKSNEWEKSSESVGPPPTKDLLLFDRDNYPQGAQVLNVS